MADTAAAAYEAALGELQGRRRAFVEHYLIDTNGAQAAIRAGYAAGSAKVTGSRLLADANVQRAIRLGMEARSIRTRITADQVLQEIARLGLSDIRKVAGLGSGALALSDLDDDTAAAVTKFVVVRKGGEKSEEMQEIRVELAPKLPALERLGRHLGLWDGRGDLGEIVVNVLRFTPGEAAQDD